MGDVMKSSEFLNVLKENKRLVAFWGIAIVLVISEETGRISLACGGRFEPVPRENLARRLVALLSAVPAKQAA